MVKGLWAIFVVAALLGVATVGSSTAEVRYRSYLDEVFGYSIDYPDMFDESDQYVDGDGVSNFELRTSDGKYHLLIWGGKKETDADGASLLKEATDMEEDEFGYVYGVEPLSGSERSGADFYSLEYETDRTGNRSIVHRYGVVGKGSVAVYELCYPVEDGERFADIKEHMDQSFKVKH